MSFCYNAEEKKIYSSQGLCVQSARSPQVCGGFSGSSASLPRPKDVGTTDRRVCTALVRVSAVSVRVRAPCAGRAPGADGRRPLPP